ncbi:GRAM domain-containing protein 2A isoform X2 [Oryctolagus cuniculus]
MRGQGSGAACPWNAASTCSLHWPEGSKGGEIKKCGRAGALLSKSNQQYHKLFKDIPAEETVLKVCSCALQRDLLVQGRLYISPNWLCFHASLFGKDIKVVIPVLSVQIIKKHKMARLLPNGLAITTSTSQKVCESPAGSPPSPAPSLPRPTPGSSLLPATWLSRGSLGCGAAGGGLLAGGLAYPHGPLSPPVSFHVQYVFVSLLSRDSVYDLLRRVCTHLQPCSKKTLSVRKCPEEPTCEPLEVRIPEMKWRNVCPASRSLSLPDNIPCVPRAPTDSTDSLFPSRKPPGSEAVATAEDPLQWEPPKSSPELRLWDSRLLKVVFVLICFLVLASSYLAVRISRLEQQLCTFTWEGPVPGHR